MKNLLLASFLSFLFAANAYLPPVDERAGVKVEIGSFPQKTERTNKNPYAWSLGVTEVKAGAPRAFPVMLENRTEKSVTGRLEVWMNDDWTVAGGQGEITLGPKEKKELMLTNVGKLATPCCPQAGSPLVGAASFQDALLSDWFEKVNYIGAFAPGDKWLDGWTEFDPQNASY